MAILTDIPAELRGAVAAYRVGQAATDRAAQQARADRRAAAKPLSVAPGVVLGDNPVRCPDMSTARQLAMVGAYQTRKPVEVIVGSGTGFLVRLCRHNLPTSSAVLQVAVYRAEQSVTEPVMPDGYVLYRHEGSVHCVPEALAAELRNGKAVILAA